MSTGGTGGDASLKGHRTGKLAAIFFNTTTKATRARRAREISIKRAPTQIKPCIARILLRIYRGTAINLPWKTAPRERVCTLEKLGRGFVLELRELEVWQAEVAAKTTRARSSNVVRRTCCAERAGGFTILRVSFHYLSCRTSSSVVISVADSIIA